MSDRVNYPNLVNGYELRKRRSALLNLGENLPLDERPLIALKKENTTANGRGGKLWDLGRKSLLYDGADIWVAVSSDDWASRPALGGVDHRVQGDRSRTIASRSGWAVMIRDALWKALDIDLQPVVHIRSKYRADNSAAALGAVAALRAGGTVNEALVLKTEAGRLQAEASDQWTYYQAKGVKASVQEASRTPSP